MDLKEHMAAIFINSQPIDAALHLDNLPFEKLLVILDNIDIELVSAIFPYLNRARSVMCLDQLPADKSARLLQTLPFSLSNVYFNAITKQQREQIGQLLPPKLAQLLNLDLPLEEHDLTVIIDTNYPTVFESRTIQDALLSIRSQIKNSALYVLLVDQNFHFSGYVHVHELYLNPENTVLATIKHTDMQPITGNVKIKNISAIYSDNCPQIIPVVDESGLLLGVLRDETIKQLSTGTKDSADKVVSAGKALADLYRIGILSLVGEFSDRQKRKD